MRLYNRKGKNKGQDARHRTEFYDSVIRRDDWEFSDVSRTQTSELTHSYHKYPAKFIPQLARVLLETYTKPGETVWDPFCGSGTLNVEAFRTGRDSLGTDVNPTALLLTRVKSKPLEPDSLEQYCDALLDRIRKNRIRSRDYYHSRAILNGNLPVLNEWFPSYNLRQLGHILWSIRKRNGGKRETEFALCAFSSVLKRSSYWLNSSVKGQKDPDKVPGKPVEYFERQLLSMQNRNWEFYKENAKNRTRVWVREHNARHKLPSYRLPVDHIITSPPYLVSYDYSDIFRLSTYFLHYRPDYSSFRRAFVGTSLRKKCRNTCSTLPYSSELLAHIPETGIRRMLSQYYSDMQACMSSLTAQVKNGGKVVMIIGDTELRGASIPNTFLINQIANDCGLKTDGVFSRMIAAKILPTIRDPRTGKFSGRTRRNVNDCYDREYVLVLSRR